MATNFEVLIVHDKQEYARQAANAVFLQWQYLESLLSRFVENSEISCLNRVKPGEVRPLSLETWEVLDISLSLFMQTRGKFDISFRGQRSNSGRSPLAALALSAASPDEEGESPYLATLLPEPGEVFADGLDLDLGGVGKGYALDNVVPLLEEWGIDNYLLSAGMSTVLACGHGIEGQGWSVGVGGDAVTGDRGVAHIRHGAISGSGPQVKGRHHINPQTKEQPELYDGVWSIASSAAYSDGLSTAASVSVAEEIDALVKSSSDCGILTAQSVDNDWDVRDYGFFSALEGYK